MGMHQKQKDIVRIAELIADKGGDFYFEGEDIILGLLERELPYYEVPKSAGALAWLFEREHRAFLLPDGRVLALEYRSEPLLTTENEFLSFMAHDALDNFHDFPKELRGAFIEDCKDYLDNRRKL